MEENIFFASKSDKYYRNCMVPKCPNRIKNIGELEGTWFEMGAQYGERVGDYILYVFDDTYKNLINKFNREHIVADIQRYNKSISYISPQAVDFMRGMSDGANTILNRSSFSEYFSDYEKILLIGCRNELDFRHPIWDHKTVSIKENIENSYSKKCSSIAILGKRGGLKEDNTIVAHNNDGPFGVTFNVSYIANPIDPEARRFWTVGLAGQLTFTQVNDKGVVITETAGGARDLYDCDFGVPWQVLTWHAIAYSKSMDEAVKTITIGNENYLKKTGRKTVMRTGGCNFIVADNKDAYILETTAHRYAIRKPGDMDESGRYMVLTNHNLSEYSFNENNSRTNFSMNFGIRPSSDLRYWTLIWLIKNHFGHIDNELVQKFMSSHFNITKEGDRRDFTWDQKHGWIPIHLSENYSTTPCAHEGGYPEKYIGGTEESKVITIKENEVEIKYIQGRPCEWNGEWEHLFLQLK